MKATYIYPGSILFKRYRHIIVIYFIGINLFINNLQDIILDKVEHSTTEVLNLSGDIESKTKGIHKLEEKSWFSKIVDFFAWIFGSPNSKEINKSLQIIGEVNDGAKGINNLSNKIKGYIIAATEILKITSTLMWLPILFSAIWLYFDFKLGDSKLLVKRAVLFALPFNLIVYYLLNNYLSSI